jgi:deazaflavin-dependent oxidoreductase (nitroreductase family)
VSRLSRLANAVPALVLASPLHRLLSGRYALVEFAGRRTGVRYRTPVAYVRDGRRVLLSTDSPWWRNLDDRPEICLRLRLRLRGREVDGRARVVTEDREAAQVLGALVRAVPGYRRPAGLAAEGGQVSDEELLRAVTTGGRRSIEITLVTSQ